MGNATHGLRAPFSEPPEGSQLKAIVDRLNASAQKSDIPDTIIGCVEAWADDLALQMLVKLGMPAALAEDPPHWLRELISTYAAMLRLAALEQSTEPRAVRRGRPSYPNHFAAAVGLIENWRQRKAAPAGTSENALNSATAAALGPGIDRDHVYRLMRYWCRHLGWLQANRPDLFSAALEATLVLADQVDELRTEAPAVRDKSRRSTAF